MQGRGVVRPSLPRLRRILLRDHPPASGRAPRACRDERGLWQAHSASTARSGQAAGCARGARIPDQVVRSHWRYVTATRLLVLKDVRPPATRSRRRSRQPETRSIARLKRKGLVPWRHRARLPLRLKGVRPVPILLEMAGINRTSFVLAILPEERAPPRSA